jgi:enoyl-CoA hydratase/carnithine racemase
MAGYPLWRGNVRDDVLRKLVYTNAEFSGAEACELGFATETADEPLARAMSLAEEIAGKNPHAIRAAKRLSNALATSTDEALLLAESGGADRDHRQAQPDRGGHVSDGGQAGGLSGQSLTSLGSNLKVSNL